MRRGEAEAPATEAPATEAPAMKDARTEVTATEVPVGPRPTWIEAMDMADPK